MAVCFWTLQIVHQKYNVCILYVCLFCHISIGGSFPPEVSVPESLLRRNSSLSASLKTRICQRRLCYFHWFVELCYFYWIELKTWRRSEARLSACTVSWSRGQAWPSRWPYVLDFVFISFYIIMTWNYLVVAHFMWSVVWQSWNSRPDLQRKNSTTLRNFSNWAHTSQKSCRIPTNANRKCFTSSVGVPATLNILSSWSKTSLTPGKHG